MTAVILGGTAALLVLRICGFRRRWPWRIAELRLREPEHPGGGLRRREHSKSERPIGTSRHVRSAGRVLGRLRSGPRGRHNSTDMLRSVPFTADLLLIATSAGHSIHSAVQTICEIDEGSAGRALSEAWSNFLGGSTLADELRALPRVHGDVLRPLVDTLLMGLSSGTPLEPALHRLADRERRRIRRRTEQRVRRLPILLLGPLVIFVLPSFVVLTIVPVVLVTARGAGL